MADVKYIVECDASGALKSIKDLDGAINQAAGTTAKAGGSSGPFGSLFAQFTAGTLVASALQKGIGALKGVVESSITAAIEAEQAENNLKAALEITGRTVEGNIQHYKKFAAEQMRATTYTDEQVMASQALLLQLTSLDQQGLDRATRGAMGLASTMGIDLHSATMMVTKAMEGNYGALGRVGIRVAENLTAEQKQASLLDQLNKLYSRSTAETETFGGALKQLANNWDEVKEAAGTAIIKTKGLGEAVVAFNRAISDFVASGGFARFLNDLIRSMPFIGKFSDALKLMALLMRIQTAEFEHASRVNAGLVITADALGKAFKGAAPMLKIFGVDFKSLVDMFVSAPAKINQTGTAVHNLTAAEIKAAKEAVDAKKKLAAAVQEIINKYNPLKAAMTAVFNEQKVLTAAFKAGAISEATYRIGMDASTKSLRAFGETIIDTAIPAYNKMEAVAKKAIANMAAGPPKLTKSWTTNVAKWVAANQQAFEKILGIASTVTAAIDAIMTQSTTNRMLLLDQEYQHRLELINNSKMNEEEKEKAITALEAEYQMKRRAEEVKAARARKAIAILTAIINTAEGVTKAWAQGGAIFGPILAAIVAAAGAFQIALIKSQPIGAAKGAIFKQRALLMSQASGQEYEVAEGGEAEIVSSPRQLREAIMGPGGTASGPGFLEIHLYIDGKEMKDFIVKTIRQRGRSELMLIHPRAVRAY
jgi:hypothetical protein